MYAKQVINIGTTANDGTGSTLRDAFDICNDNFTELYSDDAGDVGSITATAPIARDSATGAVTISLNDGGIVTDKIADDAVTADKLANSINTEIAANTAKVTNATHTGDVTGATALTIGNDKVITAKILDDNVTHAKLEARYTAGVTISTLTGTVTFDCSTASCFKMSGNLTGALTINLTNYKKGQVVSIYNLYGQSLTLAAQGSNSNEFCKIGGVNYDNSAYNILQLEVADDSATDTKFFYTVATYVIDNTP